MTSNIKKNKEKLYIPPHLREKIATTAQTSAANKMKQLPSKPVRMCDNSSAIFDKAEEIEQRNRRLQYEKLRQEMLQKKAEAEASQSVEVLPVAKVNDIPAARPETSTVTVKRMVSHALGLKAIYSASELEQVAKISKGRLKVPQEVMPAVAIMAAKEPEHVLRTAPFDPRFPNQNQTRYCYQSYLDFHRCQKVKGQNYEPCQYFQQVFKSICPNAWVEKWDTQREEGNFPGKI